MTRRRSFDVLAYSGLLALPLLALAGALVTLARLMPETGVELEAEVLLRVEHELVQLREPVLIRAEFGRASELRSTSVSGGLITEVSIEPGSVLTSTDTVIEVDGFTLSALQSAKPMARNLRTGMEGADIEAVQRFLAEAGYLDADNVDGTFGGATLSAARSYYAAMGGVGRPTEIARDWFIWIGPQPFVVNEVAVVAGAMMPGAGDVLATSPPSIESLRIVTPDGEPLTVDPARSWTVSLFGDATNLPVTIGPSGPTIAVDQLTSEVFDNQEALGFLELKEPIEAVRVPAGSVLVDNDGNLCVVVAAGDSFRPSEIVVVEGQPGAVTVIAGLKSGDQVVVNPTAAGRSGICEA